MKTLDYFPCKVCKDSAHESIIPVPTIDPDTSAVTDIECLPFKSISKEQHEQLGLNIKGQLDHCMATVLQDQKVICYKCDSGFFYDGAAHKCRETSDYSTMNGCALTYDNVKCMFCNNDKQLDIISGKCLDLKNRIEFKKLDSGMGPQYEQANQAINNRDELIFKILGI